MVGGRVEAEDGARIAKGVGDGVRGGEVGAYAERRHALRIGERPDDAQVGVVVPLLDEAACGGVSRDKDVEADGGSCGNVEQDDLWGEPLANL